MTSQVYQRSILHRVPMSYEAAKAVGRLVRQLAAEDFVPDDEPFWAALFRGSEPLIACPPDAVDAEVGAQCLELVSSSRRTQAFQHLLRRLSMLLERGADSSTATSIANAIHVVRAVTKAIIEQLEPDAASAFFTTATADLDRVVQLLMQFVCSGASAATYVSTFEAVLCLTVMLSTELRRPGPPNAREQDPICHLILTRQEMAAAITQSLLRLYVKAPSPPAVMRQHTDHPVPSPKSNDRDRGILRRMGSAASSVLSIPYRAAALVLTSHGAKQSPLGDAALGLLLLLVYHGQAFENSGRAFRGAVAHLTDGQGGNAGDSVRNSAATGTSGPTIPFSDLQRALRQGLGAHMPGLLLYTLLASNRSFTEYTLVCSEPDTVLLPLLEQLYLAHGTGAEETTAPDSLSCRRIYLLLVSMLILSQDSAYVAEVHRTQLSGSLAWFKDRPVGPISLGNLAMLTLLRSAYISLSRCRANDVYIANAALAIIANFAPQAADLSSHASQRLVSLYDLLYRRVVKLEGQTAEPVEEDHETKLGLATDFLRTVLEVISMLLANALPRNPELAYTLLHRQELFADLGGHPQFHVLARNITSVISFFNEKVERARSEQEWEWSVDRVLAVIREKLRTWHPDRLEHVPMLSFSYEELMAAADFFAPYVWQAVAAQRTWIAWSDSCIKLFSAHQPGDASPGSLRDLSIADTPCNGSGVDGQPVAIPSTGSHSVDS